MFGSRVGGRLSHRNVRRRGFEPAALAAGVGGVTLHDLRHAYGSRLASKGLSARQIADAMGHKKTSTTEIYIQRFNGEQADERFPGGDEQLVGSKTGSNGDHPARSAKEPLDENPPFAAGFLYGRCRARTSDLLGVNQALSQLS